MMFNSTTTNVTLGSLVRPQIDETDAPEVLSMSSKSIQTCAYCVLILLSLIGNTFVIATVVRNTNKRMRSVSNILIVNLSVADILVTLVNMPGKIAQIYLGNVWLLEGTIGYIMCKVMNFLPYLAVYVSTQSFSVLALDRFVAVYFPVRKPITARVAYILVAFVWLSSMGFFSIYCYSATIVTHLNLSFCTIDTEVPFGGVENFLRFVWVEFSAVVVLPLSISLVLYLATMMKLWKRRIPGTSVASNVSYTERVNRKVLKMLVTVFMVFFLCWLPSWIWIINCVRVQATPKLPGLCSSQSFLIARFIVAYSNSAITPFIYLAFSQNYRQGFRDIAVAMACCSSVKGVLRGRNRVRAFSEGSLTQTRLKINTNWQLDRLEFPTQI